MKINVNQFDVYPKVAFAGTRGSYGIDAQIEFEFGESWQGLYKTVSFYPSDGSDAVSVILGDDLKLNIPYEVMCHAGQARYVVSGSMEEERIISVTGTLQVVETLDPSELIAAELSPDIFDQLMREIDFAKDAAITAHQAADECILRMEQLEDNAEIVKKCSESAEEAALAASEAAESASLAQKAARAADENVEGAMISASEAASLAETASKDASEANAAVGKAANALIGKVSGPCAVYMEDISPIEHTLDVRVRNKNILDIDIANVWTEAPNSSREYLVVEKYGNGIKLSANEDSEQAWDKGGLTLGLTKDFLGKTLTLSFGNVTFSMQSGNHKTGILFAMCKHDNYYLNGLTNMKSASTVAVGTNVVTATIPADADCETYPYLRISFYINNGGAMSVGDYAIYEDIMVEEAESASEYVPHFNVAEFYLDVNGKAYPINADGSVEGVRSVYPSTTLTVDHSDIIIDAQYNKDANKIVTSLEERIAALESAIIV